MQAQIVKQILISYRQTLKSVYKFQLLDSSLSLYIKTMLQQKMRKFQKQMRNSDPTSIQFKNQKKQLQLILEGLSVMLEATSKYGLFPQQNSQKLQKIPYQASQNITKLCRIFSNASVFITPSLTLRPSYQSKSISSLQFDPSFQVLTPEDKNFIRKVIVDICERKSNSPVGKAYRTVGEYVGVKDRKKHLWGLAATTQRDEQKFLQNIFKSPHQSTAYNPNQPDFEPSLDDNIYEQKQQWQNIMDPLKGTVYYDLHHKVIRQAFLYGHPCFQNKKNLLKDKGQGHVKSVNEGVTLLGFREDKVWLVVEEFLKNGIRIL